MIQPLVTYTKWGRKPALQLRIPVFDWKPLFSLMESVLSLNLGSYDWKKIYRLLATNIKEDRQKRARNTWVSACLDHVLQKTKRYPDAIRNTISEADSIIQRYLTTTDTAISDKVRNSLQMGYETSVQAADTVFAVDQLVMHICISEDRICWQGVSQVQWKTRETAVGFLNTLDEGKVYDFQQWHEQRVSEELYPEALSGLKTTQLLWRHCFGLPEGSVSNALEIWANLDFEERKSFEQGAHVPSGVVNADNLKQLLDASDTQKLLYQRSNMFPRSPRTSAACANYLEPYTLLPLQTILGYFIDDKPITPDGDFFTSIGAPYIPTSHRRRGRVLLKRDEDVYTAQCERTGLLVCKYRNWFKPGQKSREQLADILGLADEYFNRLLKRRSSSNQGFQRGNRTLSSQRNIIASLCARPNTVKELKVFDDHQTSCRSMFHQLLRDLFFEKLLSETRKLSSHLFWQDEEDAPE